MSAGMDEIMRAAADAFTAYFCSRCRFGSDPCRRLSVERISEGRVRCSAWEPNVGGGR